MFSLHFVREFMAAKGIRSADFHLHTNVRHSCGSILMNPAEAAFLRPLLEKTGYFSTVTVSDELPPGYFDLGHFRELSINFSAGDIRQWYYNLTDIHLPQSFEEKLLDPLPSPRFHDKVIVSRTGRYCNISIDFGCLRKFREHLVFIGLEREYEAFRRNCFDLEFCAVKHAAEAAELIAGAGGFIGHPSGLFTLAEMLKFPRVMASPEFIRVETGDVIPGPVNVHPRGGWFEVAQTDAKFRWAAENLFARVGNGLAG